MRTILFLIGLLVCLSGIFVSSQTAAPPAPVRHPSAIERDLGESNALSILELISAWATLIGISIMAMTLLRWPSPDRFPQRSVPRIFPDLPLRNVLPWRRHRPLPLISQSVHFGLFFGSVLWILIFIFMLLRTPRTIYGLSISFPALHPSIATDNPWPQTLAIYVDGNGRFSLNGKPVPRPDLPARLQQELARCAVWDVYFEADNNSSYGVAVYAMDTIQGLGAHVIWLTPQLRQQLAPATPAAPSPSTSKN